MYTMRVGYAKINAAKTHCPKGHSYNEENTKYELNKNGSTSRKCKTCISIRLKNRYKTTTRQHKIKNPDIDYRENNVKHGEFGTRLYGIWGSMLARCRDSDNPLYGGRGISVCDDWLDYGNFAEWAKSSGHSENLTIDRIDNNSNYEPSNCRWTTVKVQANNRRSNRLITHDGITKTLQQWSDELGIKPHTLKHRLNKGWEIPTALFTPVGSLYGNQYIKLTNKGVYR